MAAGINISNIRHKYNFIDFRRFIEPLTIEFYTYI
jgi:hypothetical protein